MKWKILLFAACFFISITTTAIAAPLMINGGFETGDFSGWTIEEPPAFDGSITDSDAYSGIYSLEMGAVDWVSQSFSSVATIGDLSFWAKGTGFSGPSNVRADYSDASFNDLTIGGVDISNDFWTMFTLDIDNGKNLDKITVSVWESTPILFDDFTLEGPGEVPAIPEPATLMLFGIGILGLAGVYRKRK